LKEEEKESISEFLKKMNSSRKSICEGMILAMEYSQNARDIVTLISNELINEIEDKKQSSSMPKI
jgi:hypothetical protein